PAYQSGAVNEATNLATVPIIDEPGGDTDIHEAYHSFALSDRMDAAYGSHDNHVIWCCNGVPTPDPLVSMDAWVGAIAADHSDRPLAEKVVALKPPTVKDICVDAGKDYGSNQADCKAVAAHLSTRGAAGGPYAADVMKCQLVPLQRTAYGSVPFS